MAPANKSVAWRLTRVIAALVCVLAFNRNLFICLRSPGHPPIIAATLLSAAHSIYTVPRAPE
jgi:hypothetical protein